MAYTTLVAGTTITAAWANASVRDQSVSPFASAAARSSAITSPVEGMVSHLNDVNSLGVYSGSVWSTLGPVHGALTSVTPVVTQGATPTFTNTLSDYTRFGRLIVGQCRVAITGAGTASNAIVVSGFPACASNVDVIGAGYIVDASAVLSYSVRASMQTATNIQFHSTHGSTSAGALSTVLMGVGGAAMTAALASGDAISFNFAYEAAADA